MTVSSITSTASSATYTSPPATPTPQTSVAMSTLSAEAGIVATLGSSTSAFQTYDATGLLNQVAQAGNAAAAGGAPLPDPSTAASPAESTSVAAAVPGDWGSILKSNPALTSVAVADAVAQGIVNTINVYA
jgi:hypothetical protein